MVQVSDLETDLSALPASPDQNNADILSPKGNLIKDFLGKPRMGKDTPPPPPRARLELRAVLIVNIHTWKVVSGPMPSQGEVDWDRRQGSRGSPISRIGESVYRAEPTLCVGKALTSKLTEVEGRKQTLAVTFPLLFRMSSQSKRGRGCPEEERRAGRQTEVRGISFP